MLVKDGQEIKPDDQNDEEDEPQAELSDEEIMEAVKAYEAMKRQGKTQQTQQMRPAQPVKPQPKQQPQQDAYGEYERVPAKQQAQDDDDDYVTGWRAFLQSLSRINIKAVAIGLIVLVFAVAAFNSYRRGRAEVTATPTSAPVSAPVQPVSTQPVSQPASNSACKVTEMKVSTTTDQTDTTGNAYCLIAMDDGSTISTAGACSASQWHVGDGAVTCK